MLCKTSSYINRFRGSRSMSRQPILKEPYHAIKSYHCKKSYCHESEKCRQPAMCIIRPRKKGGKIGLCCWEREEQQHSLVILCQHETWVQNKNTKRQIKFLLCPRSGWKIQYLQLQIIYMVVDNVKDFLYVTTSSKKAKPTLDVVNF